MMKVEWIHGSEKKTCPEHFFTANLKISGGELSHAVLLAFGKVLYVALEKEPFGVPANLLMTHLIKLHHWSQVPFTLDLISHFCHGVVALFLV